MSTITMKRPKNVAKMAWHRCDGHLALVPRYKLTKYGNESFCPKCLADRKRADEIAARPDRHKSKDYFAVELYVSESKAIRNIRAAFRKAGQTSLLGDFQIPKERVAKTTKSAYDAYDHDGRLLGRVVASDEDEAEYLATQRFSKVKGGRGAYHPEYHVPTGDQYKETVRSKEGKKTVYLAMSDSGRVMGKMGGYKSLKAASEAAVKLYGPKDKPNSSPREPAVVRGDVHHVELVREGGEKIVRSQKIMPGYILVRLEADPTDEHDMALHLVKRTPGVKSLMPWAKPMTEQEKKSVEIGKLNPPPVPVPVPDSVVKRLTDVPPPTVFVLNYKVGDRVRVTDGPFKGAESVVEKITGEGEDSRLRLSVKLLGIPTAADVSIAHCRKLV